MTTSPSQSFETFLSQALQNPETRAAYEDAQSRSRLVDALVRMRRRLGLTQTQVALNMGVKQPTISGFENEGSDPRLSTILRYARAVDSVVVWSLQPCDQQARVESYLPQVYDHHTHVNRQSPSPRARGWKPRDSYAAA